MKKVLVSIVCILIICVIGIVIFVFVNKDGNVKLNTNNNIIEQNEEKSIFSNIEKDKNVNGINFSNIKVNFDGIDYIIEYTITNKTNDTVYLGEYEFVIKDKDNNILANIAPNFDVELKPNMSFETGSSINIDLSKAYSMEISIGE